VTTRSRQFVAGLLVISMVAVACSDENATNATASVPSTAVAPPVSATEPAATPPVSDAVASSTASDDTTTTVAPDADDWALDYTGGTAGPAAGAPIKIGYVNQEDAFPENTVGVDAAVAFVNAELGGAAGRPLEVVPCRITVADDGARCGTQLAADPDVVAVVTGTTLVGNRGLYAALDGVKPVIVSNGVTGDDFTTTAGHAFTAGSLGVILGLSGFVVQELEDVAAVAVLGPNDPAGRAASDLLVAPVLAEAGIVTTYVGIDFTAAATDVASAIEASGASTADAVVALLTVDQCIALRDALAARGATPAVLTTGLCATSEMAAHLGAVGATGPFPDGWYLGGYGYNVFEPDRASGMLTYVTKAREYGTPVPGDADVELVGLAGPAFAAVVTLTKLINTSSAMDPAAVDPVAIDAALRSFTGPMMMQAGPLACGSQVILGLSIFVTPCASRVGVQQYVDGTWKSIRDGLNGDPIDVTML